MAEDKLEYIPLEKNSCYAPCSQLLAELGYRLVELTVVPQKESTKIQAVVASADTSKEIGVQDVAKAHRALLPKLMALLGKTEDDIYMEVSSPGMERNIKNAAEFQVFTGKEVRVWDKTVNDWVTGFIKSADTASVTLSKDGSDVTVTFENIAKAKFIHE